MTQDAFLRTAVRLTLIYAAAFCGAVLYVTATTQGLVISETGVVGGDFLAFYTAGDFARSGDALAAYNFETFDAKLKELAPLEQLGMMWQYPPTMFFMTAPFAYLPYKISYVLWCAGGWAALLLALRALDFRASAFWLLGFSVVCVNVVDNGQISMATAALLFLSVYDPKRRWLVAGIAAGLLTIKPQLGLLLPVAFAAAGAWRAIAAAALTALILHAPSLLIFGVDGWRDFFAAVARLNADVVGPGLHTPPTGMTTLFGQLRMWGAPSSLAVGAQYVLALAVMAVVAVVWRRPGDRLGKAALVCSGAIIAAPYAYAYEMTALLLSGAYLARSATTLASPHMALVVAASLCLMLKPFAGGVFGLQWPFLISALAFGFTLAQLLRPAAAPAGLAARAA